MNPTGKPKSSPAEKMSVEIVRMILSALPDVSSLQTTVFSCPLFYRAFWEAENTIITQILTKQIHDDVIGIATVTLESSYLDSINPDPESRQALLQFVDKRLRLRQSPLPRKWLLSDAARLGRLHCAVEWLADTFVTECFARKPLTSSDAPATTLEVRRIQRALYRFEIYCNLFRPGPPARGSGRQRDPLFYRQQKQLFFENFAQLENEQLGCIHDFLFRLISPSEWLAFRKDEACAFLHSSLTQYFSLQRDCGPRYRLGCIPRGIR